MLKPETDQTTIQTESTQDADELNERDLDEVVGGSVYAHGGGGGAGRSAHGGGGGAG